MTKSELIARLGAHHPALTGKDVEDAVNAIVRALAQALHDGHRIEIRDFGVFVTVMRRAHVARNPKSGEAVNVADKYVPAFRAGKELRERVARGKMIEDEARHCRTTSDGAKALEAERFVPVTNLTRAALRNRTRT